MATDPDSVLKGTKDPKDPSQAASEGSRPGIAGWALFGQQTKALLTKNALLAWRNRASTFLQLFASLFFIFLVWAVDRAVRASTSRRTKFQNLPNPVVYPVPAIPPCTVGYYLRPDCYDFVWSGNESAVIVSLVQNISANNPGRPINFATQVRARLEPAQVDVGLS